MALDNPDWSKAGGSGGQKSTATLVNAQDQLVVACGGASFVTFDFPGMTFSAGSSLQFQGTDDGVNWVGLPYYALAGGQAAWQNAAILGPVGVAEGMFLVACAGLFKVRAILTASGGGNNQPVTGVASLASGAPLPFGQEVAALSVPVTLASDQGAIPSFVEPGVLSSDVVHSVPFAVALAPAAVSNLVVGSGATSVYLLEANFFVVTVAVALVQLQDSAGLVVCDIRTDVVMAQSRRLRGWKGGSTRGIQLVNTNGAAAAGTIAGELIYVQK